MVVDWQGVLILVGGQRMMNHRGLPGALSCLLVFVSGAAVHADSDSAAYAALTAAESRNFEQACHFALNAFEGHEESAWDLGTLRQVSVEMTEWWIPNLSREEKASLRILLDGAESPVGIWFRGLLDWKLGERKRCIEELKGLIQSTPKSVGGEHAIMGYLLRIWSRRSNAELSSIIQKLVEIAPGNPSTSWALARLTWRMAGRSKFEEIRAILEPIARERPEQLSGETAQHLIALLAAIEEMDYGTAFGKLVDLRRFTRRGTSKTSIFSVFFKDIDFDSDIRIAV